MWQVGVVAAVLLLQLAIATASRLECYSCGGLVSTHEGGSCIEFTQALSWSLFEVTCDHDQVCVKMTSLYPDEEGRQFRGCAERSSSFGLQHELGCRKANISESSTEFCFCDTNLCNSARLASPLGTGAAVLVVAVMVMRPYR